ncbi:hypothetical protein, partial [Bifidobacterium pseudolongum]|uniref:hypothetical protein n=2 Tax=Bifidobacterium pseudolongum TaxID=1694 RepID=UPI001A921928
FFLSFTQQMMEHGPYTLKKEEPENGQEKLWVQMMVVVESVALAETLIAKPSAILTVVPCDRGKR